MKRIAKFHKVSKERFTADWIDTFAQSQEEAEKVYEAIRLPKRATAGSAGYDFFAPAEFTLKPGETVKIPTGIRVEMQQEWVLKCYPRSGLGFKYRLQLNNTVGIIDSDYFYSDNEGCVFSGVPFPFSRIGRAIGKLWLQGDECTSRERFRRFGTVRIV